MFANQADVHERENSLSIYYEDPACALKIRHSISRLLGALNSDKREVVVLCIGTDRSTGDCLGPLIGTRLHQYRDDGSIYGTLNAPVHALNLVDMIDTIKTRYSNPFIIAVDASLGKADRVGYVNVKEGVLYPGTALKKSLPAVGDIHISGIVNVGGFMEHLVLQNTRLGLVYQMAEVIARGIGFTSY